MDGTRSWCHFSQNFERTRLQRQAKVQPGRPLPRAHQDERFSYVVLRKGPRPQPPADVALPDQLDWQASLPYLDDVHLKGFNIGEDPGRRLPGSKTVGSNLQPRALENLGRWWIQAQSLCGCIHTSTAAVYGEGTDLDCLTQCHIGPGHKHACGMPLALAIEGL